MQLHSPATEAEQAVLVGHLQRPPRIPQAQWDRFRPELERLYSSLKLSEVMETMMQAHNFNATERQYVAQFDKWGSSGSSRNAKKTAQSRYSNGPGFSSAASTTASHDSGFFSAASEASDRSVFGEAHPEDKPIHKPYDEGCTDDPIGWRCMQSDIDNLLTPLSGSPQQVLTPMTSLEHLGYDFVALSQQKLTSRPRYPEELAIQEMCLPHLAGSCTIEELQDEMSFDVSFDTPDMSEEPAAGTISVSHLPELRASGISTPISSKLTLARSPMPLDEERTESSGTSRCGSSEHSSVGGTVDLLDSTHRNALSKFLHWIDESYMQALLLRFDNWPRKLPSESSLISHGSGDDSHGQSAILSGSTTSSSNGDSNARGKRKFTSSNGPGGQDVQNDEKSSESQPTRKKRKARLACHFHKRKPGNFSQGRYKTCPNGFDGLNRLKDHEIYVHRPAHYCKRCKVIFKTQDLKDAHDDQDERCARQDDPAFADYLTTDRQRDALSKKKPAGMKDEDFWFQMWDGFFPGETRPASAFQDLDPTLVSFQEFAAHEVVSTLQAYHAFNPNHGLSMNDLTEFWQFAIYHAVANFAGQQRSPAPSLTNPITAAAPAFEPEPALPSSTPSQLQQQHDADISDSARLYLEFVTCAYPNLDPADFDGFQ